MDQPGKVAKPARDQLNRENEYSLSPFVPVNLVSRDRFGCLVLRQLACSFSTLRLRIWCLLAGLLPISMATSIYLSRHTPSGQSRVHRVAQLAC